MDNQPLLRPASSRPAAAEAASPHTRDFEGLRWARLGMAFGATINAGFSMLGTGLTIGWLACGPSYTGCAHNPEERFEQIVPPALGIGLLQGVLLRRVTGTLGDETGDENAIALYMPINVSPRQAFQSLFAVAFGNVALAFPIFIGLAGDTWTYTTLPQIQGSNPVPLTPTWCANPSSRRCPRSCSTERRLPPVPQVLRHHGRLVVRAGRGDVGLGQCAAGPVARRAKVQVRQRCDHRGLLRPHALRLRDRLPYALCHEHPGL